MSSACALVFSAQLGVQTLPTLLSGELFASEVRALCKGFCRAFACACLLGTLKSFPALEGAVGLPGAFLLLAGMLAAAAPVVYMVLPETKVRRGRNGALLCFFFFRVS